MASLLQYMLIPRKTIILQQQDRSKEHISHLLSLPTVCSILCQ